MKRIFYPLFVMVIVISIALPVSVFAVQGAAPPCPEHVDKTCFVKADGFYCGWTEDVVQNKLTRGRAGQVEWVLTPSSVSHVHKCAKLEHPAGK